MSLPINELEPGLVHAVQRDGARRFVVEAPTGSGKSTQIPQMLWRNGLSAGREIIILQPRRIAARMLARRVADEIKVRLGEEVGYQVRFENVTSPRTRIRFITEGILLRRMLEDPQIHDVGAVIFDEFHERHLYGDISLAQCLVLQKSLRPDLLLLVMSATLQTAALNAYLHPCTHLVSHGRTFPVDIRYQPPKQAAGMDLPEHAARVCGQALAQVGEGSALIFMPGAYEIRKTIDALGREKWAREFEILPLHGELPPQAQDAAVTPDGRRKIVVATNVAETSLTIDGIRVVIDGGQARMAAFDASRGINTLTIQSISRASADQRAGRAGRTGPGLCVRLWNEEHHGRRPAAEAPEISRLDLAEVILTLKAAGIVSLPDFPWFEPPEAKSLSLAVRLLHEIGALSAEETITDLGRRLTRYPLHPRQARMMEAARDEGCAPITALACGLLQGRSIFARNQAAPDRFKHPDDWSDFLPILRAWAAASEKGFHPDACGQLGINGKAAAEAGRLADRLTALAGARNQSIELPQRAAWAKVVLSGYSDQLARRTTKGGSACEIVGGRRGTVAKESLIKDCELFVSAEITEVQGREIQVLLNLNSEVEEIWLEDLFPYDFSQETAAVWDASQRRVMRRERVRFRDLTLRDRQQGEPEDHAAAAILADMVMNGDLVLNSWGDSVQQWLARLDFLRKAMPELEIPVFTDDDKRLVLAELFHGCKSYREIKDLSPMQSLHGWLSHQQARALDQHAPERVELAGGRKVKIDYTHGAEPAISVTIQHLYGQNDTPRIAAGRVPLLVLALAPNQRPIQVTKDLASFWKNSYPDISKELKRRYPKHEWR